MGGPKIMVHVVAYNAATTLARVLDRIPPRLRSQLAEICVFDDASTDDTFQVGRGYQRHGDLPQLSVYRNAVNRGYGGNQKLGYRYALEKGYDVVVLLHGDGQYAPEVMEDLLRPILAGEADAVFGSRMLLPGAARRGGMPAYKYLGNKILTGVENALVGTRLSEWHSGYRVYSTEALRRIPFEAASDGFHFDTQIILQLQAAGLRIAELPIPTYYGDEICYVNGLAYARDVVRSVLEYRLHQAGLARRPEYAHGGGAAYPEKRSPYGSHQRIVEQVRPGTKVLDVGCGSGVLARLLAAKGCTVFGVDATPDERARAACAGYEVADLESPFAPTERGFDYILFGDVLEHLRDTGILARSRGWLAPGGEVIASTGNVALWYQRLQLALGRFEYTPRGILDETHVRLYTRRTFRKLVEEAGFTIAAEDWAVIPVEALVGEGPRRTRLVQAAERAQHLLARLHPGLFAYQFILRARPA